MAQQSISQFASLRRLPSEVVTRILALLVADDPKNGVAGAPWNETKSLATTNHFYLNVVIELIAKDSHARGIRMARLDLKHKPGCNALNYRCMDLKYTRCRPTTNCCPSLSTSMLMREELHALYIAQMSTDAVHRSLLRLRNLLRDRRCGYQRPYMHKPGNK